MAIDSMNKVIHAAVRRDLGRLADALGVATDGDTARAGDLHRGWNQLRDQLRHHHEQEDDLLFPAFTSAGVDPDLVALMEAEHRQMVIALGEVDSAMTTYAGSGSRADATVALEKVRSGAAVVEQHLDHEEAELEPLMASRMGDPHVAAAMRQLRRQPPATIGWFFAWLGDGISPEARSWLNSEIPRPVQLVLGRGLGRGYHRTIAPIWR